MASGAGLLAGWLRAQYNKRPLNTPTVHLLWIVFLAVIPQLFVFNIGFTRAMFPDPWVPFILIISQILLLLFVWMNIRLPGFWLITTGLLLNLLVIVLNEGWMPISPETVKKIAPDAPASAWGIGERLGFSKDIVRRVEETRLPFLSDRLVLPQMNIATTNISNWFLFRVAFSIGDILIAAGTFWFFWSLGGPVKS